MVRKARAGAPHRPPRILVAKRQPTVKMRAFLALAAVAGAAAIKPVPELNPLAYLG
jgi:hypothetical protein